MSDFATIMRVVGPAGALATKRLYARPDGTTGKVEYDDPYLFDSMSAELTSFADLIALLRLLEQHPDRFLIRGQPPSDECFGVRRLGSIFTKARHRWALMDFDAIPLPYCLTGDEDREFLVGFLVRLLPREFWDASYFYQWSSGAGLSKYGKPDWTQLRCHIWFWLDRAVLDEELANWAKTWNTQVGYKLVDPRVFVTVQPNFCAPPILGAGVTDPLNGAPRSGFVQGARDDVPLVLPGAKIEEVRNARARAEHAELVEFGLREPGSYSEGSRFDQFLDAIGDDKDGFHGPITSAIASWVTSHEAADDEELKRLLRERARAAICTKARDLDNYLCDATLDGDIARARVKFGGITRPKQQRRLEEDNLKTALRRMKTKTNNKKR